MFSHTNSLSPLFITKFFNSVAQIVVLFNFISIVCLFIIFVICEFVSVSKVTIRRCKPIENFYFAIVVSPSKQTEKLTYKTHRNQNFPQFRNWNFFSRTVGLLLKFIPIRMINKWFLIIFLPYTLKLWIK